MPELADEKAMRSTPGQGQQISIYVLGQADEHADSIVPSYGAITAGCGPNLREDFAETKWPVVIKVKPEVSDGYLIQHLRDLADLVEERAEEEVAHIVQRGTVVNQLTMTHADIRRVVRAMGWEDIDADSFIKTAESFADDGCPRCGWHGHYGHHRLCHGDDGTSPGISDADLKTVIRWVGDQGLAVKVDDDIRIPF